MGIYGAVHSLLANRGTWALFADRFGQRTAHGLYRPLYNALAVFTLLPVLWLVGIDDNDPAWVWGEDWHPILTAIRVIGLAGLAVSLLQIDLLRFAGLRQFRAYIQGSALPLPPEPLQTKGVFSFVRHPLYLFSLMVLWPVASMGSAYFGFCLGATLYLTLGSLVEERRLLRTFDGDYRAYRNRVPWLVPFSRRLSGRIAAVSTKSDKSAIEN
jgi:protein-S-isoprenylcysteine O-methyltransferase Ste14